MKRLLALIAPLAGAALILIPVPATSARAAATARAAAAASPRAQLALYSCQQALNPLDRSISVQSVMRPLAGTVGMSVEFDLLARAPGAAALSPVHAAGLGVWVQAPGGLGQEPGDVWRVSKPVADLGAPAAYRFQVLFRWRGAGGRLLGTVTKLTPACRQLELRPELVVESIAVTPLPGKPAGDRYTATITNTGLTGAGPFEVLFTPGDGAPPPPARTIAFLGPHASREVSFIGPPCVAAGPPTVIADSADQIDEIDRAGSTLAAVCPAAALTPTPAALDSVRR
jgi:hypothetical protein